MLKDKKTIVDYDDLKTPEEIEKFSLLQIMKGENVLFKYPQTKRLLQLFSGTGYYKEVVKLAQEMKLEENREDGNNE